MWHSLCWLFEREKEKKINLNLALPPKSLLILESHNFQKKKQKLSFGLSSLFTLHSLSHTFSLVLSTIQVTSARKEKKEKKENFFSLIPNNNIERVSRHCNIWFACAFMPITGSNLLKKRTTQITTLPRVVLVVAMTCCCCLYFVITCRFGQL